MILSKYYQFFITIISLIAIVFVFSSNQPISASSDNLNPSAIISLTNLHRQNQNLQPLTPHPALEMAAQQKAQDMINNQYFDHNKNGQNPTWEYIASSGYLYSHAGENLARDFNDVNDLIDSWMNSPPHRANLISPDYKHIGVGIAYSNNRAVVVQVLASPPPNYPYSPQEFNTPVIFANSIPSPIIMLAIAAAVIVTFLFFIKERTRNRKKPKRSPPGKHLWHS